MRFKIKVYTGVVLSFMLLGCSNSSLSPVSNAETKNYKGEAKILISIDGSDHRNIRHIEIASDEEPTGYEVYFSDKKISEGFIVINIPTPSTNVWVKEYSLTGYYGCNRGKSGYGYGSKHLDKITKGQTYFLGTINTSMNTMYNEMPEELLKESKSKYNYSPSGEDFAKRSSFRSHISL